LTAPRSPYRNLGFVHEDLYRSLWEQRDVEQWQAIRARFGVSEVLASKSLKLRLPEKASSSSLTLYGIP
jgi:hypothetical protein